MQVFNEDSIPNKNYNLDDFNLTTPKIRILTENLNEIIQKNYK